MAVRAKGQTRNVGDKAVQEVLGRMFHYGANGGWVVTNTGFTRGAVKQAQSAGVVLADGHTGGIYRVGKLRDRGEGRTVTN